MSIYNNRDRFKVFAITLGIAAGLIYPLNAEAEPIKLPQWKLTQQESWSLSGSAREKKLLEALEQAKEKNQADAYPQSECLFNLGVYSLESKAASQAETYFKQAVDLKREGLKKTMSEGGYVAGNLPAYSNPKQEHEGKTHDLANCLSWLGRSCEAQKKYNEAAEAFNEAMSLLDTNPDPNHEAILRPDILQRAADVQRHLKNDAEAKKLEARAQDILKHRQLLDR